MSHHRSSRVVLIAVVLWALIGLAVLPAPRAGAATLSATQLKARAIYFLQDSDPVGLEQSLNALSEVSAKDGAAWKTFVSRWRTINAGMKVNRSVPTGLPSKGHAFVVLGSALTKTGKPTAKLERRLALALKALKAYPKSTVVVSGGAPRAGKTEAEVMRTWLLGKGVSATRIVVEKASGNTIANAVNTVKVLAGRFTSYSLITDSSHVRLASVLFEASVVRHRTVPGALALKRLANLTYPDLVTAGQGALRSSSVTYAASNVASVFGVTSSYKALISAPPTAAKLTGISLTVPASYALGAAARTGLVVKAQFGGGYQTVVTAMAKISGFSSATAGTRKATVSYTSNGVTKKASFSYTVRKATPKPKLKAKAVTMLSTTTIVRSKTRVVVSARITTSTGKVPTGKLSFKLDGTVIGTKTLKAADKGRAHLTFPTMKTAGRHSISIAYAGSSSVAAVGSSVRVSVKN